MEQIREFLKFAGKRDDKVLAVFATTPTNADTAVRYLRREVPDVPVWLFMRTKPADDTAALCEHVVVEHDSIALLVAAQNQLWPRTVALAVATWTGERWSWLVKLAPLLIPPFRTLILNHNGDYLPGTLGSIARHSRRAFRDAVHSNWHRSLDLLRAYWLWMFAMVAQHFAPMSRRAFHRQLGDAPLALDPPPASGEGVAVFRYAKRRWDYDALDTLIHSSQARYILFLADGADADADTLAAVLEEEGAFAVARQYAYRYWRPQLYPIAPFRQVQPGEVTRLMGPISDAILVDRAKLERIGMARTIVPGSAWLLLFWRAAAAGWRSYVVGGERTLHELPDSPYEDAEFVHRIFSDPELRVLGPREGALSRGAVSRDGRRKRTSPPSGKLRVLVVSPYLPYPLSHGGAVRIYNLCRALSRDVDFTLACFHERGDHVDYERLHDVFREVWVVDREERAVSDSALPGQVREHESAAMRALIAERCRTNSIDVLQVEFTHMAHFREAAPDVPAVLVEHDLTHTLYHQFAEQKRDAESMDEYLRWFKYETSWMRCYEAVWTMSARDRALAAETMGTAARVFEVANGVDLTRYQPAPPSLGAPEVLYIGSFRHLPNLIGFERLAAEIMPEVWRRFPDARLRVVAGPDPEKYWKRAGQRDPRITLHGFVEDVRPLYAAATVVAVPLVVSAGTNIKVMEAMACGRPVVSSTVGVQGLGLCDGDDVLVRDSPTAFADAVCTLLADPVRAAEQARRGRATVEARFSWEAIADRALASYRSLVNGRAE